MDVRNIAVVIDGEGRVMLYHGNGFDQWLFDWRYEKTKPQELVVYDGIVIGTCSMPVLLTTVETQGISSDLYVINTASGSTHLMVDGRCEFLELPALRHMEVKTPKLPDLATIRESIDIYLGYRCSNCKTYYSDQKLASKHMAACPTGSYDGLPGSISCRVEEEKWNGYASWNGLADDIERLFEDRIASEGN